MNNSVQITLLPSIRHNNLFVNNQFDQSETHWARHKVCVRPLRDKLIQYDQKKHDGRRLLVRMVAILNADHDACFVLPRKLLKTCMPKQILEHVSERNAGEDVFHNCIISRVFLSLTVDDRIRVFEEFRSMIDGERKDGQELTDNFSTLELGEQELDVRSFCRANNISSVHFVNAATRLGLLTEQEINNIYELLLSNRNNQSDNIKLLDGCAHNNKLTQRAESLVVDFCNACRSVKSEYESGTIHQIQEIVMALLLSELNSNSDLDLSVLNVGPQETFSRLEHPRTVDDERWKSWTRKCYEESIFSTSDKKHFFIKDNRVAKAMLSLSIDILTQHLSLDDIYTLIHGVKGKDIIGYNTPHAFFEQISDTKEWLVRIVYKSNQHSGTPVTEFIKAAIMRGFLPQECIDSILEADEDIDHDEDDELMLSVMMMFPRFWTRSIPLLA